MRTISVVAALCLIGFAGLVEVNAGVSKKLVDLVVDQFNEEARAVRPDHLMLPVNYVELAGQSYAYAVPRRMKRLVESGAQFRLHKLKTKRRYLILEVESDAGARIDLFLYDNQPLTQTFVDEVVPTMLRTLFEFGEAPQRPPLVGNRLSHLLHIGSCNHLPDMAEREEFNGIGVAESAGYRSCPVCFSQEQSLPFENYSSIRWTAIERARLFQLAFPPVADDDIQEKLRSVGEEILDSFPLDLVGFDYEFVAVHSAVPQAVAFPTGFVFVTDRLLAMIEHDLELRFVVAHEIAHCELNLPPVGSSSPSLPSNLGRGARHDETVADLVAVSSLHELTGDPTVVSRARSILAKLQFAFEALPLQDPDAYASHPTYTSRLQLFDSGHYEPVPPHPPMSYRPFGDDSAFDVRVLGKTRDESRSYVYLLVEGTDLANRSWNITTQEAFANLVDAKGNVYWLRSAQLSHEVDAGDTAVIKATIGDQTRYDTIDLNSDRLSLKAPPLEYMDG